MSARIRVLLVDDHTLFRDGLAHLLSMRGEVEVVGAAPDAATALDLYRQLQPDVTLVDLRMPGAMGGVELIEAVRRESPEARFIVLTTYDADEDIQRAMRAGAGGYLLKDVSRDILVEAITSVFRGRRRLSPELAARAFEAPAQDQLTERELAVLRLMAAGQGNKSIARGLGISEATVKWHVTNILGKLGVTARTEAVVVAVRRGLVKIE